MYHQHYFHITGSIYSLLIVLMFTWIEHSFFASDLLFWSHCILHLPLLDIIINAFSFKDECDLIMFLCMLPSYRYFWELHNTAANKSGFCTVHLSIDPFNSNIILFSFWVHLPLRWQFSWDMELDRACSCTFCCHSTLLHDASIIFHWF